jgi:phosphate transport system substrate-binding protein
MKKILATLAIVFLFAACFSCSRSHDRSITLAGSTAFQPFAEKLAEQYMTTESQTRINVQGGGSAVGIQSAISGTAQIGVADLLSLPDEARDLKSTVVARDGIALIVHPANSVTNLTAAHARSVFTGKITNWKDVGGSDQLIRIFSREEGSGTRRTFDKLVLGSDKVAAQALFQNSNGTIREAVANDEAAIGYLSIGLVDERVKALSYNGVAPNNHEVKAGRYPLSRPIFFLTKKDVSAATQNFIDYVLSKNSQTLLEQEGLIAAQ